ncbi:MAG: type II toxin-antitoxin system Phd/YefM family antitoxin [Cellvibrio sp.]|uniref:type II toxin-antitoxin system Phd/YefM family antitoxin n=1 Tax=Cellvibrio sp. TaxID=1965322 RepID=UPI0027263818|nr:type II toxin-antitoxin system Phd/YefM family antitoxin [Cellvibrio sp.]
MITLTVNQAQAQFEDLLTKVQHNPIAISRNGEPIAVMISMAEYSVLEALKLQQLQQKIKRAEEDIVTGRIHDGDEVLKSLIVGDTK